MSDFVFCFLCFLVSYYAHVNFKKCYFKNLKKMHSYVFATLFTIANLQKQPKCPLIDEWMKKFYIKHIYNIHITHTYILTYAM